MHDAIHLSFLHPSWRTSENPLQAKFAEPDTYELRRIPLAHSSMRKVRAPDRGTNPIAISGSSPSVAWKRTFGAVVTRRGVMPRPLGEIVSRGPFRRRYGAT